jgi:uroporphyrinogen III methyltransferase / synthase
MDLQGKRILITRPRAQSAGFARRLEALGAVPILFPVIEIAPVKVSRALDQALRELDQYDWLVLTSANGVQVTWKRLSDLHIQALPEGLKVAAIGPKTAAALRSLGVKPDFVPDEYVAEAILPGLGELRGCRVLLLRADLARPALPQAIRQGGGVATELAVYNTVAAEPDPKALEALRQGVDVVTFTSSSTVRNFVHLVRRAGMEPAALPGNPLCACIGPITAQTAREEGLSPDLVASEYTTEGLINALLDF